MIDDDHYVTISDRKKDVIISGGENVSSIEVEDAIASHPNVREVAVKDVNAYEAQLLNAIKGHGAAILKSIRDEQKISDEVKEQLKKFLEDFTKTFTSGKKAA